MFIFGAALASLFGRFAKARSTAPRLPSPAPAPGTLFALVQTKPHVVVLAISPSEDELLKEVSEMNATWNHWDLRCERHRFEVQRVPILVKVPPAGAPAARAVVVKSK